MTVHRYSHRQFHKGASAPKATLVLACVNMMPLWNAKQPNSLLATTNWGHAFSKSFTRPTDISFFTRRWAYYRYWGSQNAIDAQSCIETRHAAKTLLPESLAIFHEFSVRPRDWWTLSCFRIDYGRRSLVPPLSANAPLVVVVRIISHKAASPPRTIRARCSRQPNNGYFSTQHSQFSRICQVVPMCTPPIWFLGPTRIGLQTHVSWFSRFRKAHWCAQHTDGECRASIRAATVLSVDNDAQRILNFVDRTIDRRAVAKFLSEFGNKVPKGNTLIFGDTRISLSLHSKKHASIRSVVSIQLIPACERRRRTDNSHS